MKAAGVTRPRCQQREDFAARDKKPAATNVESGKAPCYSLPIAWMAGSEKDSAAPAAARASAVMVSQRKTPPAGGRSKVARAACPWIGTIPRHGQDAHATLPGRSRP